MKPPAREPCLDALEDLWRNYDDAKFSAAKVLQKWRPGVLAAGAAREEEKKPIKNGTPAQQNAQNGADPRTGLSTPTPQPTAVAGA